MIQPYVSHPWHGITAHAQSPEIVTAFIEIVPTDTVKYEIDKASGYLKVDRPQKYSNVTPALYGFIPRTYCDELIAQLASKGIGKTVAHGDGDPLDICVLTERTITHGNIILNAIPIGGIRLIDKGEADDKLIAVMQGDEIYQRWKDIKDCPESIVNRLIHYFLTYKNIPGQGSPTCEIGGIYGKEEAQEVIRCSQLDYVNKFSLR